MVAGVDLCISIAVIHRVAYTEIDWRAYMQEVEGPLLEGQWDYLELRGDTGPLVYPAGFVWVFIGIRALTDQGMDIRRAQYLFAIMHALLVYFFLGSIYYKPQTPAAEHRPESETRGGGEKSQQLEQPRNEQPPLWVGILVLLSRRTRSIFVLRLFNDCVAMVFLYCCIFMLVRRHWNVACFCFSAALSIKMNIVLFAPGLAVVLLQTGGLVSSLCRGTAVIASQAAVALPFLQANAQGYMIRAFELGRVFTFKWTVNFAFLPESIFVGKPLAYATLTATLVTWLIFGHLQFARWTHSRDGLVGLLRDSLYRPFAVSAAMNGTHLASFVPHACLVLFTSNFVGIVFARSIHYQFYAWYYHSLGYLAYRAGLSLGVALVTIGAIEVCFNVFPATPVSSAIWQIAHLTLLVRLILRRQPDDLRAPGTNASNKNK